MEGILVTSYFFCLLSVPYLDQQEIKLRKKFISLFLFHQVSLSYARVLPSCHINLLPRLELPASERLSSICKRSGWKILPVAQASDLQSLFLNNVAGLRPTRLATLLKKRLWHRWFPVNFTNFLRTPFLQNTPERLLLDDKIILKGQNTRPSAPCFLAFYSFDFVNYSQSFNKIS